MMTVLLESAAARRSGPRRTPWAAVSLLVHAAIVAGAIVLTTQSRGDAREPDRSADTVVIIPMPPQPASPRTRPTRAAEGPAVPATPDILIDVPVVPVFDPGLPYAPAPLSAGVVFARPPAPGRSVAEPGGIYTMGDVERVAMALTGNGSPDYPRMLRDAGVEGEVLVQFVVDTTGRVERGSVRIVRATHAQFAQAVTRWLPMTRYAPAEIAGRRVRQLVQLPVGFSLTR